MRLAEEMECTPFEHACPIFDKDLGVQRGPGAATQAGFSATAKPQHREH
jgi:hypothetical protein